MVINGVRVFRSNRFSGRFAGYSYGYFAVVRYDAGPEVIEHEVQHCKDFQRRPLEYLWNYKIVKNWKFILWAELRGYSHNKSKSYEFIARALNEDYGLKVRINAESIKSNTDLALHCTYDEFETLIDEDRIII